MMTPTDQDLTDRFERLEVDATTFGHRDHVAAGYGMLRRYSFVQATARYAEVLREMTVRELRDGIKMLQEASAPALIEGTGHVVEDEDGGNEGEY